MTPVVKDKYDAEYCKATHQNIGAMLTLVFTVLAVLTSAVGWAAYEVSSVKSQVAVTIEKDTVFKEYITDIRNSIEKSNTTLTIAIKENKEERITQLKLISDELNNIKTKLDTLNEKINNHIIKEK